LLRLDPESVSIPILLCTGAAREVDALRDHLATLGVTGVLKPFRAEKLLAAIADASTWSDADSAPTGGPCDRGGHWSGRR